jgi:hypothetical protein
MDGRTDGWTGNSSTYYLGPVHTGSQVTCGRSVQSQPLRAWRLGLPTSHTRSRVLSSESLEVDPCNLSR